MSIHRIIMLSSGSARARAHAFAFGFCISSTPLSQPTCVCVCVSVHNVGCKMPMRVVFCKNRHTHTQRETGNCSVCNTIVCIAERAVRICVRCVYEFSTDTQTDTHTHTHAPKCMVHSYRYWLRLAGRCVRMRFMAYNVLDYISSGEREPGRASHARMR